MGESDSYYDWERSLSLSAGSSKPSKQTEKTTKIGISRKELRAYLKEWKKENPTE